MRLFPALVLAILTLIPAASFAQVASALPTFADCSIASMSGSSQKLGTAFTLATNFNRKYLYICNNTSVAGDSVGVNLTGGTAALNGAGTVTLVQGACLEFSANPGSGLPQPPSGAVTVIGTSSQPVLCYEGR